MLPREVVEAMPERGGVVATPQNRHNLGGVLVIDVCLRLVVPETLGDKRRIEIQGDLLCTKKTRKKKELLATPIIFSKKCLRL